MKANSSAARETEGSAPQDEGGQAPPQSYFLQGHPPKLKIWGSYFIRGGEQNLTLTEDEEGNAIEDGSHVGQQPHRHGQLGWGGKG